MRDLALPERGAHDALNDAVMAAMAFIKLRRLRRKHKQNWHKPPVYRRNKLF